MTEKCLFCGKSISVRILEKYQGCCLCLSTISIQVIAIVLANGVMAEMEKEHKEGYEKVFDNNMR